MVKNREINGTDDIGLVTPTPGAIHINTTYITFMRTNKTQPELKS